jgi:hypothetical protein
VPVVRDADHHGSDFAALACMIAIEGCHSAVGQCNPRRPPVVRYGQAVDGDDLLLPERFVAARQCSDRPSQVTVWCSELTMPIPFRILVAFSISRPLDA